jgi:hypothetical protein
MATRAQPAFICGKTIHLSLQCIRFIRIEPADPIWPANEFRSWTRDAMPREHRKRGKRKKNENEATADAVVTSNLEREKVENENPSWIETAEPPEAAFNPEAPFGFCDPDVKAYFRTVDKQLMEWQELGIEAETDRVEDPNLGESLL